MIIDAQIKSVLGSTCPIASISVKNPTTAFVQFGPAGDTSETTETSTPHPISLIKIQSYCDQVKVSTNHQFPLNQCCPLRHQLLDHPWASRSPFEDTVRRPHASNHRRRVRNGTTSGLKRDNFQVNHRH